MADPLVRGVILDVDSPGGEVGGLFDLVARIAALKASFGKPLWAVANEDALSAAYAIASAADRIYVTQTGEVGSVGVPYPLAGEPQNARTAALNPVTGVLRYTALHFALLRNMKTAI